MQNRFLHLWMNSGLMQLYAHITIFKILRVSSEFDVHLIYVKCQYV